MRSSWYRNDGYDLMWKRKYAQSIFSHGKKERVSVLKKNNVFF